MTENGNANTNKYDLLLERFQRNVQKNPNKVAIAYLKSISNKPNSNGIKIERQLSYQELDSITTVLANRLRYQYNIQQGDRVVLVYPPSLDFMISFIGCCKANIIAVPVFPPNPNRKDNISMFCKIVKECDAKYALTNKDYNHIKKLSSIQDTISKFKSSSKQQQLTSWPDSLQWIVTDNIMDYSNNNEKKSNNKGKKQNDETKELVRDQSNDQIAFLQFTSGSTSDPKGVMITHGNLGHNLTIITNELQADANTVVVSWLPQYHDMGLIGSYLGILYCGGTGYYMSPLTFLQRPAIWIEAISLYKATHLQAPNFAFKLTVRKFNPDDEYIYNTGNGTSTNGKLPIDLSSVRHVINAAEPVDEESLRIFYGTFSKYGFRNGVIFPTYGLAEHTVFVCSGGQQLISVNKHELEVNGIVHLVEDNDTSVAVSRLVGCGYPEHQNVVVKIVKSDHGDDTDENDEASTKYYAVEEDIVGEIWIHSQSKAAGYYNKPVESKHDFYASLSRSDSTSPNEYLRTGDLGFLHNKELFICGRLKDLIIIGGRNYYPQDIEYTAESALSETQIRYGCSAAFTINPTPNVAVSSSQDNTSKAAETGGGGEEVAVIMELRDVPAKTSESTTKSWESLADQVKAAITQEHSLSISVFIFVKPRTVPKTSSGKIARSWCRKSYVNNTLQIVYKKSYNNISTATTVAPLEIEGPDSTTPGDNNEGGVSRPISTSKNSKLTATELRALSKEEIIQRLVSDVAEVASIPAETIDTKVALATIMDSIAISQFKGYFEINYHVQQLSDEYLLRDTSSITKLCEIVKLGYAPDDNAGDGTNGGGVVLQQEGGKATGLAGALGCPPGVVCVIL